MGLIGADGWKRPLRCRRMRPGTADVGWQAADPVGLPDHLHRQGRDALAGGGYREPPRGIECVGEAVSVVKVDRQLGKLPFCY